MIGVPGYAGNTIRIGPENPVRITIQQIKLDSFAVTQYTAYVHDFFEAELQIPAYYEIYCL